MDSHRASRQHHEMWIIGRDHGLRAHSAASAASIFYDYRPAKRFRKLIGDGAGG
jgi:hypothetical protein